MRGEENIIQLPLAGSDRKITINPSKIIAVGLNYVDHVKESESVGGKAHAIPKEPVLFAKTPNVLIGPGDTVEVEVEKIGILKNPVVAE